MDARAVLLAERRARRSPRILRALAIERAGAPVAARATAMTLLARSLALASLLLLSACSGARAGGPAAPPDDGGVAPAPQPDAGTAPAFAELDGYFDERLAAGLNGLAMLVFDANDRLVYKRESGACVTTPACPPGSPPFTVDLVTGIASSSKWVTSTTVLAVLEEQVAAGRVPDLDAALDTKVAPLLACDGLAGPVTDITMRHLLSFTSGLVPDHPCIDDATTPLTGCACTILADSAARMVATPGAENPKRAAHPPGTTYKYGASHHAVAGAVVERLTEQSWNDVFETRVRGPLGLSMRYKNPKNLAGSIDASAADVARFVGAVFHDGRGDAPKRVLSKAAVEAQRADQVAPGAAWLLAPQEGTAYGLNTWRWCYDAFDVTAVRDLDLLTERPSCDRVFQSGYGGKGGYQPFLDAGGRYYGVLAIREAAAGGGADYDPEQVAITIRTRLYTHLAMTR